MTLIEKIEKRVREVITFLSPDKNHPILVQENKGISHCFCSSAEYEIALNGEGDFIEVVACDIIRELKMHGNVYETDPMFFEEHYGCEALGDFYRINIYFNFLREVKENEKKGEKMWFNQKAQEYWKIASGPNAPEAYINHPQRTALITNKITGLVGKNAIILELGCNVGRNLAGLWGMGYTNILGVDINPAAILLGKRTFPSIGGRLITGAIETTLPVWLDDSFDVIFTMAVLMHIPYENDKIFKEIVKKSKKYIVLVECETGHSHGRIFPRDYNKIFTKLGCKEVKEENIEGVEGLDGYILRIFRKNEASI